MRRAPDSDPRLELVLASSEDDCIGRANALPWRLPDDLKRFKSLTWGKPVLMGRKTYEAIGKALPGRTNIVLSRSSVFVPGDALVVPDLESALAAARPAATLMVIGGAEIYAQTSDRASAIHLTRVHTRTPDGDAFFGGWREAGWTTVWSEFHPADSRHEHAFSFVTLTASRGWD